ncbi:MAG: MoxR family ATPase [Burkholderiaceae bacterium]
MLDKIQSVAAQVGSVVVGKQAQIRLALACVLARGHLLVEDVPGVGKTTLAQALSISLGMQFKRVQFTNDLLPADIVGVNVFDRNKSEFVFHPGPVFSEVLLADEINRASPKTQSALLEAMEERQVSVDGRALALPDPFFVIATQNPQDQVGTFALPESQLDRFLMCIELGYPDSKSERALLAGHDRRDMIDKLTARISPKDLQAAMHKVREVTTSNALLDYVQNLLTQSRRSSGFAEGLSPRAGLGLMQAARAWALLDGRNHVLPDDIQAVMPSVAGHRLRPVKGGVLSYRGRSELVSELVQSVPVP